MHKEVDSLRRNLEISYILALQFEANLIHHEDYILLKIIVLLQIDVVIRTGVVQKWETACMVVSFVSFSFPLVYAMILMI